MKQVFQRIHCAYESHRCIDFIIFVLTERQLYPCSTCTCRVIIILSHSICFVDMSIDLITWPCARHNNAQCHNNHCLYSNSIYDCGITIISLWSLIVSIIRQSLSYNCSLYIPLLCMLLLSKIYTIMHFLEISSAIWTPSGKPQCNMNSSRKLTVAQGKSKCNI